MPDGAVNVVYHHVPNSEMPQVALAAADVNAELGPAGGLDALDVPVLLIEQPEGSFILLRRSSIAACGRWTSGFRRRSLDRDSAGIGLRYHERMQIACVHPPKTP